MKANLKEVDRSEAKRQECQGGVDRLSDARLHQLLDHLRQIAANLRAIEDRLQGLSNNDPGVDQCVADIEENQRKLRGNFSTLHVGRGQVANGEGANGKVRSKSARK